MLDLLSALSDDLRAVDWIRFLALALGSLLTGFSLAVMAEARKFRMPPGHVWAIATSYIIMVVALMVQIGARWGESLSWRSWIALAAFAIGLYSQWLMYRAYAYATRLRRHERKTVEAGNRIMHEVFRRSSPGDKDHSREEDGAA